jgi:hypothetical protein
MEKWIEKIRKGDARKAAKKLGLHEACFYRARMKGFKNLTPGEIDITSVVKKIVEDRERTLKDIAV